MLKYIRSLTVRKADGSETGVSGSEVALDTGVLMGLRVEDSSVKISVDPSKTTVNPDMLLKYQALLNGGSGVVDGVPYQFSGAPYYYNSVADVSPVRGCVWLLGGMCDVWGLFEDGEHAELDSGGGVVDGTLSVTDVCPPCVDCADYHTLYRYLDAMETALTDKKDTIYAISSDYTEQNNILTLYRQTILYWNNIVQMTAWRCNLEADGSELDAAVMFTNHFDVEIPSDMSLSIMLYDGPGQDAQAQIIDVVVPPDWDVVDYTTEITGSPVIAWENLSWTADTNEDTVTCSPAHASESLPSIGDNVRIYNSSDNVTLPDGAYEVLTASNTSFTLAIPVMGGGATAGSCDGRTIQKLTLTTSRALAVGDAIKLYIGSITPIPKDPVSISSAIFGNNLSTWFPGFPDIKFLKSNNMVVFIDEPS